MNSPLLTPRRIIVAVILFFVIGILSFVLSFSWLTISSETREEKIVYIRRTDGTSVKNFTLPQGSKRLLMSRGEYTIEVSSGDSFSSYQKNLKLFSDKLEVELVKPKSSVFLGNSELPCSKQQPSGLALFYSCGLMTVSSITLERQAVEKVREDTVELPETIGEEKEFSTALEDYGEDFIEATVFENKLTIRLRNQAGAKPDSQPVIVSGFSGRISDAAFSASQSANFSVFNTSNNEVLLFADIKDASPGRVKLEGRIDEGLSTQIFAGPSYTFLVNSQTAEHLEDLPEGAEGSEAPAQPKIIVIDNKEGKIVKEQDLPAGLIARSIVAGPNDRLLFLLTGDDEGEVHLYSPDKGLEQMGLSPKGVQQACWKDNNSFYYLADAGRAIYLHSLDKQASFRLYAIDTNFIRSLSCSSGQLYFAIDKEGNEKLELSHYNLGTEVHTGSRVEGVLPFYYTMDGDTLRFEETRSGVTVTLAYDSNNNGPPDKDAVIKKLTDILKENGVETKGLNIKFSY